MCEVLVGGHVSASLLDWPGKVCATLFTAGCNLRCPFCHNPELVPVRTSGEGPSGFLEMLHDRRLFLDGVCVSGGEPCMQRGIGELLGRIKSMGLLVKLDTNGTYPEVLRGLLEQGLVDMVAMDIKAHWDLYPLLTGGLDVAPMVRRSLEIIRSSGVDYELRTTWVPALMSVDHLRSIRFMLKDDEHWVVQPFRPGRCLKPELDETAAASPDEIRDALGGVRVRG